MIAIGPCASGPANRSVRVLRCVGLAAVTACTPRAPVPGPVIALDEHRTLTVTDDRTDLGAVISLLPDSTRLVLGPGNFRVRAPGIQLERKHGLAIEGQGAGVTTILFAPTVWLGFDIRDSVTDFTLERVTLRSAGGEQPRTQGFGSTTGRRGIRGIVVRDIEVRDLGLGISVGAGLTGEYDSVLIERNVLRNLVGTTSGSGYGIHNDNASNVVIRENEIRDAQRHSIYQSRGSRAIRIERNLVVNHGRHRRPGNPDVAAIAVARSSDVTLIGNVIVDPRAVAISVEYDDVLGLPIKGVALVANTVIGWRHAALLLDAEGEFVSCANRFSRPAAARVDTLRRGLHGGGSAFRSDSAPPCSPLASTPPDSAGVTLAGWGYAFDGRCIREYRVGTAKRARLACFRG